MSLDLNHYANRHGAEGCIAATSGAPADAAWQDWSALQRSDPEGERFQLFVQPIVSLAAATPVIHVEALLRLVDEEGRTHAPATFMPLLERLGMMPLVDRWVLRRGLSWWREHGAAAGAAGRFALNLSTASLADPRMTADVMRMLREEDVDPSELIFEVTETHPILDLPRAAALLGELRGAGAEVALDDFGTGYASFHYLKALPLDYLKAAGSFVRQVNENPVDLAFVASMNLLAHELGLQTIAEFVETPSILEVIREIGLDFAQGYEIAHPRPIRTLVEA